MKTILVPTDFSTQATHALKVAASIAKKNNSHIVLMHTLEIPSQMKDAIVNTAEIPQIMLYINKTKEKLTEIAKESFLKDIQVTTHVHFEPATNGIVHYTQNHLVDLIVMGSKGTSGMNEILVGSNTEKVVRQVDLPVLVIKNKIDNFEVNDMVFASDFSEETKKTFQKVINMADFFNAKLHLVMISTSNNFTTTTQYKKLTEEYIHIYKLNNYTVQQYNDTHIENGILNFANSIDADLIAIGTHGRTGLAHFFNGSITEDLVNHTVKPVITFKI
jgi:nucleotide-binding universal stress UspA family protein